MKRAQVEDRYSVWQSFTERFAQFRLLAGYQGKVMPDVGGVLDVAFDFLLDWFGVGVTDSKSLIGM